MPEEESPYQKLGLSCLEGKFYICAGLETEFLGCCDVDPCTDTLKGHCPQEQLGNATYSTDSHYTIPAESCENPDEADTYWFTCSYGEKTPFSGTRPFMGCCHGQNPCEDGGCATDNMRAATLSKNETERAIFTDGLPGYDDGDAEATSTSTALPDAQGADSGGLGTGAIIGIGVGAAVVVIALIAILMWRFGICCGKKRRNKGVGEKSGMIAGNTPRHEDDSAGGFGHPMSPHGNGKPGPYRESYMTGTTAYSPIPPHGSPDHNGYSKNLPGSPPPSAGYPPHSPGYLEAQRYHDQSPPPQHPGHISTLSGWSGYTNNTNTPPQPYGHPGQGLGGWGAMPSQQQHQPGEALGGMHVVAELPEQSLVRPVSELPPDGVRKENVSELATEGGGK